VKRVEGEEEARSLRCPILALRFRGLSWNEEEEEGEGIGLARDHVTCACLISERERGNGTRIIL